MHSPQRLCSAESLDRMFVIDFSLRVSAVMFFGLRSRVTPEALQGRAHDNTLDMKQSNNICEETPSSSVSPPSRLTQMQSVLCTHVVLFHYRVIKVGDL